MTRGPAGPTVPRFLAAGFLTLAVATGCSNTQTEVGGSPPSGPGTVSTTPAAATGAGLPSTVAEPPGRDDHDEQPPALAMDAAGPVAAGFAAAWVRSDLPAEQWLAGVAPWSDPRFAGLLRTTDPARLPARAVTGAPVLVGQATDPAIYTVATDSGVLTVTVAAVDGRWLVTDTDFTRSTT